jgi:hypothetical protein
MVEPIRAVFHQVCVSDCGHQNRLKSSSSRQARPVNSEAALLVGIAMAFGPRINAVLVEYLAQWNAIERW